MTYRKIIGTNSVIGIIGGGQLGRMLAFSAKKMGYQVGILDPEANCPGGQVADWQLQGAYDNALALAEMAERCDVLTYEFENVDSQALGTIAKKIPLPQGINLLEITQNREREKAFLVEHHLPVANYRVIKTVTDCQEALQTIGYPAVLKTIRGGYDGHGQLVIKEGLPVEKITELVNVGPCILEEWLLFDKEVSIMVARNQAGEISLLPIAENEHRHNILHKSSVPAKLSANVTGKLDSIARKLAQEINLQGILGIEFFIGQDEEIVINEMAPRPHNSGHFSIEACDFSQFDLHILAICNRPLPQVTLLKPVVMLNILGQHVEGVEKAIPFQPNWHSHFYGKKVSKHNRKMGHLTILTDNFAENDLIIKETAIWE